MNREEEYTKLFIKGTDEITEVLKKYEKSKKVKPDDVRFMLVTFVRLINRVKGKCRKEIMRSQGIKVVREFRNLGKYIPEYIEYLPEIPEDSEDEKER